MKIKPTPTKGRVVVEMDRADEAMLAGPETAVAERPSPFRLRKILVPIDFSDCSRKALHYALPFAREFGAQIVLLHVVQAAYDYGGEFGPVVFPELESEWRARSETELRELARKELGEEIESQVVVRAGQPSAEIVEVARALETDLIIISTHGRTGLKHVLLGSQAENVVRHAPCPVLTVREHEHEFIAE